jgi:hypothetical protein
VKNSDSLIVREVKAAENIQGRQSWEFGGSRLISSISQRN